MDENDLNRDGVVDAEGVDYARANGGEDGKPDAVVLAAFLVPDTLLPPCWTSRAPPPGSPSSFRSWWWASARWRWTRVTPPRPRRSRPCPGSLQRHPAAVHWTDVATAERAGPGAC